ncbi:MAG: tetratricopeptide repeat protein [Woeseiaceae bacterium]|nr:tetratricopeptide repeat protein [Woeseiaceae bacterium]
MRDDATIREGIARQRRGEFDAAAAIYTGMLEQEPDHAIALHYLGLLRFQQDRLEEAERLLDRSLRQDPGNANTWSDLGMVRVRAGTPDQALECFSKALGIAPNHPDALNNMAQALCKLGRFDQARPPLERLVTLQPTSAAARYSLADAQYKSNEITAAIANFQKAIRLAPDDRRIRLGLGEACESAGRFKQAKMQYLSVLRRDPKSPLALARLLQLRAGETDAAWVERARSLADDPDTPEEGRIRLNIALGYYHDRHQEHAEAFRRLRLGYDAQAVREPFDADGYTRAIDSLIEVLDGEFYQSAPTSGNRLRTADFCRWHAALRNDSHGAGSGEPFRVAAGGELFAVLNVSYQIRELSAYPGTLPAWPAQDRPDRTSSDGAALPRAAGTYIRQCRQGNRQAAVQFHAHRRDRTAVSERAHRALPKRTRWTTACPVTLRVSPTRSGLQIDWIRWAATISTTIA